ncbi:MAG: penicillin-binding protein 2, partial [Stellaceae bacterium]
MSQTPRQDDNPCRPIHLKPMLCAPAPTDGPGRSALEICHTRLIVAGALFVLAFLLIGAQLVDVMELKSPDKKEARNRVVEHIGPARADIVDRNGVLLATTLDMPSLYANPKQIADKGRVANELAQLFPELSAEKLIDALDKPNLSFVWIKHDLTPRQLLAVNALGEHGLQFINEERRVYPKGNLLSHVVGFVNSDGKGMAGIEAGLEKRIKSDATPVRLSVDARVQFILRSEILNQMAAFDAKRGFGIV